MTLIVSPCGHDAATYAVTHWHYSKTMPRGALAKYGAWENDRYIGCVLFGRGATSDLGKPYGLDATECVELVRVALREHLSPVTQIVARSIKLLKNTNPGLRLIISFADPEQGHHGGIYQAGGWTFLGRSKHTDEWIINGRRMQGRAVSHLLKKYPKEGSRQERINKYIDGSAVKVKGSTKYRYAMPLDKVMRRKLDKIKLPYPRAVEGSEVSRDTSGIEGQVRSLPTAPQVTQPSAEANI